MLYSSKVAFNKNHLYIRKEVAIPHQEKQIQGFVSFSQTVKRTKVGIIMTHGAGGDVHTQQLQQVTDFMVEKGFVVLRFNCKSLNIVYRKRVFSSVLKWYFERKEEYGITSCFVGGRSMGSRAAVLCCNDIIEGDLAGFVKGVICLAYPLHPVNQLGKLRAEPLQELSKPVLFVSGDCDNMATKSILTDIVKTKMKCEVTLQWIPGADHSHHVKGRGKEEVNAEICVFVHDWIQKLMESKRKTIEHTESKGNSCAEKSGKRKKLEGTSTTKIKRNKRVK